MFLKSIFDRTASFFGLIFLFPILIIVGILIRIKMPGGPVIFKQRRVGRHGKLFTMYKFRSMTVSHSGSSVSVRGENRITPLGAKLRKYKLDELLELWKPGITGPASLKYRDEEELLAEQENPQKYNDEVLFPDKVRINIEYLDNWSFWNDIKIIIYTILGKDL